MTVLDDFLAALDSATTTDDLHRQAEQVTRQLGFEGYTYHLYRPGQGSLIYVGDWKSEWVERYDQMGYADIDPVVERVLQSVTPFKWADTVIHRDVGAPERAVLNEARAFGMKAGAEFPIHEHGLGGATFSVFSNSEAEFQQSWQLHRHTLHVFCLYFHERYCALMQAHEADELPAVSKRERECLVWTSRGKTAWEIGEILHISERTVKEHLDSASRKLGSFSKHHAVVKAILGRIILP
ncbi:putative transcriptional activator protein vanR [Magnetospirillum sp. LM-5]|uniref:helix-turn-helix transcriptional regulator n=1 Tax=Magnetospirillum sp. LM-5 TaxID=2681466 RepID=UPI00138545D5|nr:LuxR family transcriptional regulator [Magnetospirillum sp. LM-5]CAA7623849.1 putative transcriptional activator protein vanR [Magnetospirillum sp. LM-5]